MLIIANSFPSGYCLQFYLTNTDNVFVSVEHIVGQTRRSSFFASVNAKHALSTFAK